MANLKFIKKSSSGGTVISIKNSNTSKLLNLYKSLFIASSLLNIITIGALLFVIFYV